MSGCGNCDNCLVPPEAWDGTVAAQKMLSTIYRLWKERGQRYGAGHLIDILRGKQTPRVLEQGHGSLTVFGIGQDLSEQAWRSVLRQLLAHSLLKIAYYPRIFQRVSYSGASEPLAPAMVSTVCLCGMKETNIFIKKFTQQALTMIALSSMATYLRLLTYRK